MSNTLLRIHQHSPLAAVLYRLTDAGCVMLSLALALSATASTPLQSHYLAGAAATTVFFVAAEFTRLYRNWRGASAEREMVCVLFTWSWTLLGLLVMGFMTKSLGDFGRRLGTTWFLFAPPLMVAGRMGTRFLQACLRSRGIGVRGFAIIGATDLGVQLARNIGATPELGLKLVGFYDDRPAGRVAELPAEVGRFAGNIDELIAAARRGEVHMIYITFPMRAEERIRSVLNRLADSTASVYIVPDFFVFELLHSRWTDIGGLPAVSIFENPLYGVDGLLKRAFDFALAGALLAALSLPMLVIAALIKLTSRGPVFFRQKRYGLDGREILVWKFRSMTVCENGPTVTQAVKNDARVTPLGAILRKTSLDELPQLFNVLEGTMSLVGPRPHASAHNEQYRTMIQGYMLRHKVKPGITGLAQVSGWRGETDTLEKMERRIECDHRYIREWSLWLDVKILFKTLFVVLARQNAY